MPISITRSGAARAKREQREGHADVVVEVSLRGEDGIASARMRGENRGNHFLHRRLSVAARERHDRDGEFLAPVRGEPSQRGARVVHDELRVRRSAVQGSRDERGGRAAAQRLGDVFVPVESLAGQRHEKIAGVHAAAVSGHTADPDIRADEAPREDARGFRKIHHRDIGHGIARIHRAPRCQSASAARATSRSSNGWRTPAISW